NGFKVKSNISFLASSCQKFTEVDNECKPFTFYENCTATEVAVDALGEEWEEYRFRISGREEKIGFVSHGYVLMLLNGGHSCDSQGGLNHESTNRFKIALIRNLEPKQLRFSILLLHAPSNITLKKQPTKKNKEEVP
ncbi:40S ribosomal protein S6, partial [Galemys pyrenaicus]